MFLLLYCLLYCPLPIVLPLWICQLTLLLFEGVCSKLTSSWPPAREVGLGTAALAPLWADNRDPGDPGMNSARPFFMRRHCKMDTFARNWASNFRQIWENSPGHPKAPPRYPKGTQNAVKCDMVSTTCSKMPSNATWFRQHFNKRIWALWAPGALGP